VRIVSSFKKNLGPAFLRLKQSKKEKVLELERTISEDLNMASTDIRGLIIVDTLTNCRNCGN